MRENLLLRQNRLSVLAYNIKKLPHLKWGEPVNFSLFHYRQYNFQTHHIFYTYS